MTAVAVTMKRAVREIGVARTAKTLTKLNQVDGFDCQSSGVTHASDAGEMTGGEQGESTKRKVEPEQHG